MNKEQRAKRGKEENGLARDRERACKAMCKKMAVDA
jgi:hypothetical protein